MRLMDRVLDVPCSELVYHRRAEVYMRYMRERYMILVDLKWADRGIDAWENSSNDVAGFVEQQLSLLHVSRQRCLDELKEYKT